jgi:hypothetical protein
MSTPHEENDALTKNFDARHAIRRCPGLQKELRKFFKEMEIDRARVSNIVRMFSSNTACVPVWNDTLKGEIAFCFWGYFQSSNKTRKFLDFFIWLFRPRIFVSAPTKTGNHVETCMIINLKRLFVNRDVFEIWLDSFLDAMQMSAGHIIFSEYMGPQMTSCIERIIKSPNVRSNLYAEFNKDFLMLYQHLSKAKAQGQTILTNMTRNINVVDTTEEETFSLRAIFPEFANSLLAENPAEWNWRVLLRTRNSQEELSVSSEDAHVLRPLRLL